MEDFKIILYVVAALAWMFFKNYDKIKEEASKRNPSKPPDFEPIPEPTSIPLPKPAAEPLARKVLKAPKPVMRSRPVSQGLSAKQKRTPLVKESMDYKSSKSYGIEGGILKPSDSVHFDDPSAEEVSWQNPIVEQIRDADFRQAVLLSEILQRPYN